MFINEKKIGTGRTYIIAEVGNNHNGSLQNALKLVDLAIEAQADCVKFQMRSLNDVYRKKSLEQNGDDLGSDYIIDLGPDAGVNGGEVVAQGNYNQLKNMNTWTGKYLSKTLSFDINSKKPSFSKKIKLIGARHNNLKNIDVIFPLNSITAVTGVSGSGKSTLIKDVLLPAIKKKKDIHGEKIGEFTSIEGDFESFQSIEFISQKPIGVSSRSNPVTYIKAVSYTHLRAHETPEHRVCRRRV